jgi:dienelactone hydrolase
MELLLLETFAAVFLLLHLLRPVFKGLWKLNGLVLLPAAALGILTGIFPAYGFRPECLPLLAAALYINYQNTAAFFSLFSGLQNDDYRDRGPVYTAAALILFGFVCWTAWRYAPPLDAEPGTVETMLLQDRERNEELWLRVYGVEEGRPLMVLIPPVAGSVPVTDAVCAVLAEKGLAVLTYSRPGFDSPALDPSGSAVRLSLPGLYRLGSALIRGHVSVPAAAAGTGLEEGRFRDLEFLVRELSQNKTLQDMLPGVDRGTLFIAGYGAGGAAAVRLAETPEFSRQIKAVVAVESPFLSTLEVETPKTSGIMARRFLPGKITGTGKPPRPEIPVLYIVSERAVRERNGRYATIFGALRSSRGPALLAALSGAGPFDYSDSPRLYPLYSVLFGGKGPKRKEKEYPAFTASLMVNFAALVMETETPAGTEAETAVLAEILPESRTVPPKKTALEDVYLETGRVWNLGDSRLILKP